MLPPNNEKEGLFPMNNTDNAVRIAHDTVNNVDIEVNRDTLIQLMKDGRQVDFVLHEVRQDEDGYMSWDVEFWSYLDNNKFIRTYAMNGRTLREFNRFNIYDMATEFDMDRAKEIRIS